MKIVKKVLIISPHFPPVNAADMHRVRQGLPFFKKHGWEPIILCVNPKHVEQSKDTLLLKSIPEEVKIIQVSAFSTKYTRKIGLGNLGLRAFWQMYFAGNKLIKENRFDLIYFSTTVFSIIPLGRLWKQKFKIPFIIDIQDPWRNDYYLNVSKDKRPAKFWFDYWQKKKMEAYTIPSVDGLISVSKGYTDTLKSRYPSIKSIPSLMLSFGAAMNDFEIVEKNNVNSKIKLDSKYINLVYVGRGGHDMNKSVDIIFKSFKKGLSLYESFNDIRFWFVGTSYAAEGKGEKTIFPLAKKLNIESYVNEITDRQPYFEAISLLKKSDVIIIPGSDDEDYTASKLHPNILAEKPLIAVFHPNSSVVDTLIDLNIGEAVLIDDINAVEKCMEKLYVMISKLPFKPKTNWKKFEVYTDEKKTEKQCHFFNKVLS